MITRREEFTMALTFFITQLALVVPASLWLGIRPTAFGVVASMFFTFLWRVAQFEHDVMHRLKRTEGE